MTELLDRIRTSLVGLRMPRALEALDHTLRRLERGELTAIEAIDGLLAEEHANRETRRIAVALKTARLNPPKTLEGFDFSFQPSLDRNRILALAKLDFVARAEVLHFRGARQGRPVAERKAMIDRDHRLSLGRQARALGISRGSVYTLPRPTPDADLALMRRIDELHLEYPFAGSRMLKGLLKAEGYQAGRLHVSTLMKKMTIEALYRRPNTSKPARGHTIYPYLLRNVAVARPNQVWAMDITYIRRRGALSIWRPSSTGSAARSWPGGCRSRCRRTSASRRWKRRSTATAGRKSSTPTRARSSPAPTSSTC